MDNYLAKIRAVCNGSSEDRELYELIENFCRQPEDRRGRAFIPLLKKIQGLKGLTRSKHLDFGMILQDTWVKVYQQIASDFEPQEQSESLQSSLVTWVNQKLRLKYREKELWKKPKLQTRSLDVLLNGDREHKNTLGDLLSSLEADPMEQAIQEEEHQKLEQKLKKLCAFPDHPPNYPECTIGKIAQRLSKKNTWKQIKAEFDIPPEYQLRNWFHRQYKKIRKSLEEE
ncbi:MAG: hypothetical protein F6K54_08035 [Okeania sp. SIO3B5]|uniref:hypothetical protein n=1 Tax=Okeania sp. SIO3B5 TaxID=2607811 RepID=UPI0013FED8BC|nr:hypothetical protein [Okeania sp. SIO3B5]NEO53035.1 hypothetical protein [Okeania sp. SIO3B5]